MNDKRPIGLFDSGIGGTSIWRSVHAMLPNENTIFIGDSLNAPYGQKSKDEIIQLSKKNVDWLLAHDAKIIIVACNTATTNAIVELRQSYDVPIIGIEPAIKPAAMLTQTGKVGVLATKGTLMSQKYEEAQQYYPNVTFINQIGYDIVQLMEDGKLYAPELERLLRTYIDPMLAQNIDYLVLGCTHYPYLAPILDKFMPSSVKVINSGEAVAKQTLKILSNNNLLKTDGILGTSEFYTNKDVAILQSFINGLGIAKKIDF
ncbi:MULTISPECIES: glutamate racemase [unclassified Flavobacterium]|uniref:glutamate racemase n=1 Tax=unclassified Flavobacterium TaxID=196869 RepID=UPI0013CFD724|nr:MULTISPECIES: glutamate racemase [unclassified Flavobacterium]MBA5792372.1 glutamate racemase [Flavobacterium sp. xlx-221]